MYLLHENMHIHVNEWSDSQLPDKDNLKGNTYDRLQLKIIVIFFYV